MKPKLRIDEVYAYVAVDEEGEGITAYMSPDTGHWMPMVGADMDRMRSLLPVAQQLADKGGKDIKLVRYAVRTEIDTIVPRTTPEKIHRRMEEPAAAEEDEPEDDDEGMIYAQDLIVVGMLSKRGPAIVVTYLCDGEPTVPVAVANEMADELVRLVTEAQTAIKRISN